MLNLYLVVENGYVHVTTDFPVGLKLLHGQCSLYAAGFCNDNILTKTFASCSEKCNVKARQVNTNIQQKP